MAVWKLGDIYDFNDTDKLVSELNKKVDAFAKLRPKLDSLTPKQFMDVIKAVLLNIQ